MGTGSQPCLLLKGGTAGQGCQGWGWHELPLLLFRVLQDLRAGQGQWLWWELTHVSFSMQNKAAGTTWKH